MTSQGNIYDVVVVGSGAAGMTAALAARRKGLEVLVLEKEPTFGGTSSRSGGWLWIPCNPLAVNAGIADDLEAARTYLRNEAGNHFNAEKVDAFLEHGPAMVEFLQKETAVEFFLSAEFPDYHPDTPGGVTGGRSIGTEPFDARGLGPDVARLSRPLRETTFLGMSIGSGTEIRHFFNVTRSIRSALYVSRVLARYGRDILLHKRGMRLTNGNALIARLAKTAFELGIPLWTSSPATGLLKNDQGRVCGVVVDNAGKIRSIEARRGVVLASGGFSHDAARARALYPHLGNGDHVSPTVAGAAGDGLCLGEGAGGNVDNALANPAAWAPVSRVRRRDGSTGLFPHFVDRPKPGVIAVTRNARRFVNEANSYHDFIVALLSECRGTGENAAYLICDHATIRRYGLGFAKPFPVPIGHHVRSGYLLRGRTIAELAQKAGLDPQRLGQTIARYNDYAQKGEDPDFGKGSTAYNRFLGDPGHQPNPCLAPVEHGPFYAVKVVPADIGTYAGLKTDRWARVLDAGDQPILGLYAAGNDSASIMGGNYPGGGITLGPGMTFGYVAALHMAKARDPTG
ncbi:MAG: FAD-dependent oxidoreductase [Roseomonas sp.]|nr:FAD-dependent oxidoreductase [Roseomonas sp.]